MGKRPLESYVTTFRRLPRYIPQLPKYELGVKGIHFGPGPNKVAADMSRADLGACCAFGACVKDAWMVRQRLPG